MGRRKNYPWDSKVDKQMTNLVITVITWVIFAPILILLSIKNKKLDNDEIISGIFCTILLLPPILLTPSIWNVLCGFDFITRIMLLIWIYILIGCLSMQ